MSEGIEFEQHRRWLLSLSYRMLGSAAEAEDVVQDAYLRWRDAAGDVTRTRSFLATVVTRLCIDRLRSARVRREHYVGSWLPEPLVGERYTQLAETYPDDETLSYAFLVLLETLNPVERAVFLLREIFEYDYAEISEIVGKSEINCRQIARRARGQIESRRPRFEASRERREELAVRFAQATRQGDLPGLIALLDRDIVFWSDGGGKARAALRPVRGASDVARLILGVRRKFGRRQVIHSAWVNGHPGFISCEEGRAVTVLCLEIADGRIQAIHAVRNPDKLAAGVPRMSELGTSLFTLPGASSHASADPPAAIPPILPAVAPEPGAGTVEPAVVGP